MILNSFKDIIINNIIYKLFHFLTALFLALEVALFFPEPFAPLFFTALFTVDFLAELFFTSFFSDATGVLTTSLTTGDSAFLITLVTSIKDNIIYVYFCLICFNFYLYFFLLFPFIINFEDQFMIILL